MSNPFSSKEPRTTDSPDGYVDACGCSPVSGSRPAACAAFEEHTQDGRDHVDRAQRHQPAVRFSAPPKGDGEFLSGLVARSRALCATKAPRTTDLPDGYVDTCGSSVVSGSRPAACAAIDRELLQASTRRHFFRQSGFGVGGAALAGLLNDKLFAAESVSRTAKAKSIIYLFMAGAPSQVDLLDPKPVLQKYDGQNVPAELTKGERFAFIKGTPKLLGSPFEFKRCGESGAEISELLPHLQGVANDLTIIRSLHTTQFNHAPAQIYMNTGFQIIGRPSMGAWMTYGLGSECKDLPGFVVLVSGENQPDGGKACWGSGFLPSTFQGVEFRSQGDPVLFLTNPDGVSESARRASLDLLKKLNQEHLAANGDPEIATRIASYEMAYKMQSSVPDLADISKEPPSIHELYGTQAGKKSFANNCLLARRLVQRGVRFVQLYHRGWDNHGTSSHDDIVNRLPSLCEETDRAAAALITDLKQQGLLDSTIVIWGGEFGRTPMNEARDNSKFLGRDHHPRAFSMWVAGGGFKRGFLYGQTDELGYNIASDPVDVHNLHATILWQMGIDHTKLTYRFQGRDFRLTDVAGNVVQPLLA